MQHLPHHHGTPQPASTVTVLVDPAAAGVKFCIFYDPVGPDSGALRIIPGSHTEPLHASLRAAKTVPAAAAAGGDGPARSGDRDSGRARQ